MSQSFSLAFQLDERAGDGHIDAICLISKRIHLHDKRAGVSMSWVMTRADGPGCSTGKLPGTEFAMTSHPRCIHASDAFWSAWRTQSSLSLLENELRAKIP